MKTIDVLNNIEFKDENDEEELEMVHIFLYLILIDMAAWHNDRGYTMVVTDLISTEEEDISLGRESDAHRTKRGADLRSRHMEPEHREEFKALFNKKYEDIASISRSDNKPRLVVEHGKGMNRHFHVALNFKYRITE